VRNNLANHNDDFKILRYRYPWIQLRGRKEYSCARILIPVPLHKTCVAAQGTLNVNLSKVLLTPWFLIMWMSDFSAFPKRVNLSHFRFNNYFVVYWPCWILLYFFDLDNRPLLKFLHHHNGSWLWSLVRLHAPQWASRLTPSLWSLRNPDQGSDVALSRLW